MALPLVLSTDPLEHPAMDYDFLRREGIRWLERLSAGLWTDFNLHDPGITILEQLCYAITDLAYRINYDIKDLLVSGTEDPYRSLYSPAEALTINPVTMTDIRKLVLDVPGVKNVWVQLDEGSDSGLAYDPSEACLYLETSASRPAHHEPVALRGIYRVVIEKDADSVLDTASILFRVDERLQACRSLGEDFAYPESLQGQAIVVNAEIEVGAVDNPELLLAKIYMTLADFISPRIHFHTLQELLDQGRPIDEILNGPVLEHGFIEDAELDRLERKTNLRTSDLIQEIMNVQGVLAVNKINISAGGSVDAWFLKLDSKSAPYLDIENSLFPAETPKIRLTRKGIPVRPDPNRVRKALDDLRIATGDSSLPESQRDIRLAPGRDRKTGHYHSIQNQFPTTYGIGPLGLADSASTQRKAQAKQLKAYLLFFDQLLANYFAQLANASKLFSFYSEVYPTYFSQIIAEAGLGLEEVYRSDEQTFADNLQKELTEKPAFAPERKNRFLNHLLARFAEQFTDYSLLLYADLKAEDFIDDKSAFLRDYKEIGISRGTGFDYTQASWGTDRTSGLEKRIKHKLGISDITKRSLADLPVNAEGGFHLLEHILFRPREADRAQVQQANEVINWQASAFLADCARRDPYSHQLSFVFPDWIQRFDPVKQPGFPELIEKTIREETPAHIKVSLYWLGQDDMRAFESAYQDWLENVKASQMWNPAKLNLADEENWLIHLKVRDARDRMIQILGIGTPYPLRDLKLHYAPMVAFQETDTITILGAQFDVLYQLCDEDGNPIKNDETGNDYQARRMPDGQVVLVTPKIQKDITFTILAIREHPIRLEVYMNQSVSIQAGIDDNLRVAFEPDDTQIALSDTQILINYNSNVTVKVFKTQEGISYQLLTESDKPLPDPSVSQKGNTAEVSLLTTKGFPEDTTLKVLAYRTISETGTGPGTVSKILKAILSVNVRPNPGVGITPGKVIVDYDTETQLSLTGVQASAGYQLYKRDLVPEDYVAAETPGRIEIKTPEGKSIFIKPPEKVSDWDHPKGFAPVGAFTPSGGNFSVSTRKLQEDTLFIVRAIKNEDQASIQLDQAIAVLVKPNPAPAVSVEAASVPSGTAGLVIVTATQKGVAYQLRLEATNELINSPGYHVTDRFLERTRIEVDFSVGDQGMAELLLPTVNLTAASTFHILATKILTGLTAVLNGKATIGVS